MGTLRAVRESRTLRRQAARQRVQEPGRQVGGAEELSFAALAGTILLSPLFRGLFFPAEQMVAGFVLGIAVVCWLLAFRARTGDWPDLSSAVLVALPIPLAYLVSTFAAAAPRAAVQELLRSLLGFATAILAAGYCNSAARRFRLADVLLVGTVLPGLVGYGVVAKLLEYPAAVAFGRLQGSLQYANTLGGAAATGMILALGLATTRRGLVRSALAGVAALQGTTMLASFSRGAWLVSPVGLVALWLAMPRDRGALVRNTLAVGLCSLAGAFAYSREGSVVQPLSGILAGLAAAALVGLWERFGVHLPIGGVPRLARIGIWVATLLVLTGIAAWRFARPLALAYPEGGLPGRVSQTVSEIRPGANYHISVATRSNAAAEDAGPPLVIVVQSINEIGAERAAEPLSSRSARADNGLDVVELSFRAPDDVDRLRIILQGARPGVAATVVDATLTGPGEDRRKLTFALAKLLPAALAERIESINLRDFTTLQRTVFYTDALKVFRDRWLAGAGGGGWKSVYLSYQSYNYTSTLVHSFPLQLLVETGLIGLAALALSCWGFLRATRAALGLDGRTDAVPAALAGLVTLGAHSLIDFDLSLGSMWLLLWGLIGLIVGSVPVEARASGPRDGQHWWVSGPGVAAVAAVLAVGSAVLWSAHQYGQAGARYLVARRFAPAVAAFERAAQLDPLAPHFRIDLAQALERQAASTQDRAEIQRARDLFAKGVALDSFNADFRVAWGQFLMRRVSIDEGLAQLRQARGLAPFYPKTYESLADALVSASVEASARGQAERARRYAEEVLALPGLLAEVKRREPPGLPPAFSLGLDSPRMSLHQGQAEALLGRWERARERLTRVEKDSALGVPAQIWLALIDEKSGRRREAVDRMASLAAKDAGAQRLYSQLLPAVPIGRPAP